MVLSIWYFKLQYISKQYKPDEYNPVQCVAAG